MTITYFEIGRIIVEEEQNGKDRAEYGKQLLKDLSKQLTKEFGRGFSIDNLENMRKLFLTFSKSETLSRILQIQKSQSLTEEFKSQKTQSVTAEFNKVDYQTLSSFFKLSFLGSFSLGNDSQLSFGIPLANVNPFFCAYTKHNIRVITITILLMMFLKFI